MLSLADLAELHDAFRADLDARPQPFNLRGQTFSHYPDTALMGVINLSPDSSYRETVSTSADAAIRRGRRLMADGARIIDIGAQSSNRGRETLDETAQISRLVARNSRTGG